MGTHFREQDGYTQILEVTPHLRQRIEAAIDNLVSLLDSIDPDPDFEPENDSEPQGDHEPSLGWITLDNGRIFTAGGSDLELDLADHEPDDEGEQDYRDHPIELRDADLRKGEFPW